jgi:hypothetical protein
MIEDCVEILRRPYDSHVNLAAGRTHHTINFNQNYRSQPESRIKPLPRISSEFINKRNAMAMPNSHEL